MLTSIIVRIIDFCIRNAWRVVAVGLLLTVASGVYAARHFAINSDINTLLPSDLGWRERELAFEQAFHRFQQIIVVVEAPTPELTSAATDARRRRLRRTKTTSERFAARRQRVFRHATGCSSCRPTNSSARWTAGAGGTAHPRSRRRSEPARAHRGARRRAARHPIQPPQARRFHACLQHGLRYAGERDQGRASELLLARAR